MHATLHLLTQTEFPSIRRGVVDTLQVNLGYRCNLTILELPGHEDLAQFLAAHGVEVVASMPCYLEDNVDRQLATDFGVVFNQLFTLVNMPIQRFGSTLVSKGQFDSYMALLRSAHRDANLPQVMCRSLVSVDWQGYLYDCDFNQQLGLPLRGTGRSRTHLTEITAHALEGRVIRMANHCFGCTAGQGSSCGGALEETAGAQSACTG